MSPLRRSLPRNPPLAAVREGHGASLWGPAGAWSRLPDVGLQSPRTAVRLEGSTSADKLNKSFGG